MRGVNESCGQFFNEAEMIKPSVGRVVWYYPVGASRSEQPLAAIVAHVWSDTCVNLAIFDANGRPMEKPPTSVLLVQPENEVPGNGGYCEWMPYQIGQAAKHETAKSEAN